MARSTACLAFALLVACSSGGPDNAAPDAGTLGASSGGSSGATSGSSTSSGGSSGSSSGGTSSSTSSSGGSTSGGVDAGDCSPSGETCGSRGCCAGLTCKAAKCVPQTSC